MSLYWYMVALLLVSAGLYLAWRIPVAGCHRRGEYVLAGGRMFSLVMVWGPGYVNVHFLGDGDGLFNIRVFADGVLEEEFSTKEERFGYYSFGSSLVIALYNRQSYEVRGSSVSLHLRGLARHIYIHSSSIC